MDKQAKFLWLVKAGLFLAKQEKYITAEHVMSALGEALFIPISALPDKILGLNEYARDFCVWQSRKGEQPEWYLDEWVPEDW